PTSGSTAYTALTLNWAAHPGVDFYDMQADTSASFNSPVLFTVSKAYVNTSDLNTDTEHYLENLFFGKTYYWRVRARNAVDTSLWTMRNFITINFVNLSSPTSGSTQWTALTLNWAAHPGVDFYDMQADTSASFNSPVLFTVSKAYVNTSDLNTDTEHYLENLFFGKTYYWRVRARNAVDTSLWTMRTFITKEYVTLISPVNNTVNINVAGITLDWAAHEGIDAYQLQMDTTNTFTSSLLVTINKTYINSYSGNSDTETQTGSLLTNQVYYWRVRAINAMDTSLWITYIFSTGSFITGINAELVKDENISISPNPVNSNLTLVTKQTFTNSTIIIYSSAGQKIIEKKEISGNIFDLNVSEYKPGLYFIEIIEKGKKVIKRFVKN
ncbi:MAG TPA: T9SS type A sorting domain-containing protein, partial [Bacteroidales bacterium]|nr:T9SS type A sorting domain-containing protein [Bacteroidales bacterium]